MLTYLKFMEIVSLSPTLKHCQTSLLEKTVFFTVMQAAVTEKKS